MPTVSRRLPQRPHLDVPKREARALLQRWQERDPAALDRLRGRHPKHAHVDVASFAVAKLQLHDAQLVVAREYGFPTWADLKQRIESNPWAHALELAIRADDRKQVAEILRAHPELLRLPVRSGNWGPPLSHAANLGRLEIMRIAHELGAVDLQHALGRALLQGHLECARWLLSHGAKLAPGEAMGPCECLNLAGLRFLDEQGATLADAKGNRLAPLALVLQTYGRNPSEKHAILEFFLQRGWELPDTPVMALHRGRVDLLVAHLRRDPRLVERRFSLAEIYPEELGCASGGKGGMHGTPIDGVTLLHLAVEFDEQEIFDLLLEQGADPGAPAAIDAAGFGGHSSLFNSVVSMPAACGRQRDARMTRELLRRGASREVRVNMRKFLDWQETPGWHTACDVTPEGWARGFPQQSWVNSAAVEMLGVSSRSPGTG